MLSIQEVNYRITSAVCKGDIRSVRELIHTFGLSYSSPWSNGYVLLLKAIKTQHTEITKLLLTYGSKVNNKNNNLYNNTLYCGLYCAIKNCDIEIVKMLLDRGVNIGTKNGWMSNLLLDAIQIEKIEMTELILIYETLLQYGFIINPEDANNPTLLHTVVEKGYLKIVEDLLKYGADVNVSQSSTFKKGYTLLHSAAKNNQEEVAKLLIRYGANINAKDERENTPIFYAIENVDLKITKLLLTNGAAIKDNSKLLNTAAQKKCKKIVEILLQHGADVNRSDEYGRTALHFTTSGSLFDKEPDIHVRVEIAEMLLSKGANVNAKDKGGKNPIFYAIKESNLKITKLLLTNGADIKDNPELLNTAVGTECREIVEILLSKGANVNAKDESGDTPIFCAVQLGNLKITKLLLTNGADIKDPNLLNTAVRTLNTTVRTECREIVEILLEYSADINASNEYGTTALHCTAMCRTLYCNDRPWFDKEADINVGAEIAEMLLSKGANVNAKDGNGNTPIFYAIQSRNWKITEMLLNNGADVRDPKLVNAAVRNNYREFFDILLKKGANVNGKDENGYTPIFYAIHNLDLELTKLLLTNGADVKDNPNLLRTAAENKCKKIVEILLQHGADVNGSDEYGRTALHFTAFGSRFDKESDFHVMGEIAEMLVSYGANVNAKDESGNTPIYYAIVKCDWMITKLLLTNGADIKDNPELLIIAVTRECKEIVEIILEYGADINITTNDNYTPLECAYGEVSRILNKHTVKIKAAGLYVNERNSLFINNDEMRNFQNECEAEIKIMKGERINNSNASFYDIVTKSISQLAPYARNENIVQALKSDDYKTKFPIYTSMINIRFRMGIEKKELLEQGYRIFHSLFDNYFAAIPRWCIEKILSYLSVKDLRILIDACKALNNTYIRDAENTLGVKDKHLE